MKIPYFFIITTCIFLGIIVNSATAAAMPDPGKKESAAAIIGVNRDKENTTDLGQQLIEAASDGNLELVKQLIAKKAPLNEQSLSNVERGAPYGNTALIAATRKGFTHIMQALLDAGAHINKQSKIKTTALEEACWVPQLDAARLLLTTHTNVSVKTTSSCGLVDRICNRSINIIYINSLNIDQDRITLDKHIEIIQLLLKANAPVDTFKNYNEETTLMKASNIITKSQAKNTFCLDMMKLLLAAGAEINNQDCSGYTALMAALATDNTERARLLILAGADLDIEKKQASKVDTAWTIAHPKGFVNFIDSILREKRDYEHKYSSDQLKRALQEHLPSVLSTIVIDYENEYTFLNERAQTLAAKRRALAEQMNPHLQEMDSVIRIVINYVVENNNTLSTLVEAGEASEEENVSEEEKMD